jgi:hypothetical protein
MGVHGVFACTFYPLASLDNTIQLMLGVTGVQD